MFALTVSEEIWTRSLLRGEDTAEGALGNPTCLQNLRLLLRISSTRCLISWIILCTSLTSLFCFCFGCWLFFSRESVFGYIMVLPGAFSAYRYRMIARAKDHYIPASFRLNSSSMDNWQVSHGQLEKPWHFKCYSNILKSHTSFLPIQQFETNQTHKR